MCAYTRRTANSACFTWSARVEGGDRGRWDDLAMTENVGLGGGQRGGVDGGSGAAGQAHGRAPCPGRRRRVVAVHGHGAPVPRPGPAVAALKNPSSSNPGGGRGSSGRCRWSRWSRVGRARGSRGCRRPREPRKNQDQSCISGVFAKWGYVTRGLCGVDAENCHLRSHPREPPAERVFGRRDGVGAVR